MVEEIKDIIKEQFLTMIDDLPQLDKISIFEELSSYFKNFANNLIIN